MTRPLAAACLAALLAGPALAQQGEVRLPTEEDAVAIALGAETVFFGPQGVETLLPGPVRDEEHVAVGLGLGGAVVRVVVEQRLIVTGLGDFQFKVPGPARDVVALAGSEAEPGLRRGSILWQGFSDGEKLLAARMPLFPRQEAARLPVAFDLSVTVGGAPLRPGARRTGALEARLSIRNISAVPVSVTTGAADPVEAARLVDRLREALLEGVRPRPGRDGLPEAVAVAGEPVTRARDVEAPFRVAGRLAFPPGTVEALRAEGGTVEGSAVGFDVTLGGGRPLEAEVVLRGRAANLELPTLEATGEPALPAAEGLVPPRGGSWEEAVASGAAGAGAPELLALAGKTLWQVARIRQFDAYLGNPDPTGPATTAYTFSLEAARTAGAGPTAPPVERASALGLALLWLLVASILLGGLVVWAHA